MTRIQLTDIAASTVCALLGTVLFLAERHSYLDVQPHEWPSTANEIEIVCFCAMFGLCIAGPAVLGAEYLFGRRRAPLTAGEILWLCPLSLWLLCTIGIATAYEHRASNSIYAGFIAIGGLFILALISTAHLACWLLDDAVRPAKRWTDWAGLLTCWSVPGSLLYVFVVHMPG